MTCEFCENIIGNFSSGGQFESFVLGGAIGALIALGLVVILLLGIGLYIYHSIAWSTIAKKLKYKQPWLAWIPFANVAMILQMGGFGWGWIFLLLIPILGWIAVFVLFIISMWRIFDKLKHPGWFSLSVIIPEVGGILYLIAIGIVAWSSKKKK
ncbi:MAG: hypothetical protein KKF56_02940 [Nanoarchaeota archaeon]|nr:hypothetical protein [Nanoarchaeota archaeon]